MHDRVIAIAKPLIQEFEDCKLYEYLDMRGLPTIGWGVRIRHNEFPRGLTQAEADRQFDSVLEGFYNGVYRLINGPCPIDYELASFTSFTYNIGFGSWHPFVDGFMTSTLLRLYNQGKRDQAALEFPRWDHAGGKEVPGLLRRRKCEQLIFQGTTIEELKAKNWLE